ncbi:phage tail protein [Orbus mooreae]|uniref:phage tail protein n=1 Tax=Orbus mooreae TaxID=3074107 RepID=UPI00370CFE38
MEYFHWCVAPNMQVPIQPKVKTIKFGDGYEQRIQDGINSDLRSYSISLTVRRDEDLWIDQFLTLHAGYKAFLWRNPHTHKEVKVKCQSWSVNVMNTTATITATFEEVVS